MNLQNLVDGLRRMKPVQGVVPSRDSACGQESNVAYQPLATVALTIAGTTLHPRPPSSAALTRSAQSAGDLHILRNPTESPMKRRSSNWKRHSGRPAVSAHRMQVTASALARLRIEAPQSLFSTGLPESAMKSSTSQPCEPTHQCFSWICSLPIIFADYKSRSRPTSASLVIVDNLGRLRVNSTCHGQRSSPRNTRTMSLAA